MFEAGLNPYQLAFWALPILATPYFWSQKSVSRSIALVFALALVGWGLLVGGEFWFEEELFLSLTDEQRLSYQDGVAGKALAVSFGFPIALIHAFVWFLGTKLVSALWKRNKGLQPKAN